MESYLKSSVDEQKNPQERINNEVTKTDFTFSLTMILNYFLRYLRQVMAFKEVNSDFKK